MGRLIAVIGNSGVGKTALTQRLCQLGAFTGGLEQHQARPFQGLFAQETRRYGLANQVDYLLLRAEQEASIRASDLDGVQDGGLELDFYVFTRHFYNQGYLSQAEYELCQRLYHTLRRGLPAPEVFVSMTAPLEVIAGRFARRGRALEIARLEELQALQVLLDGWLEQAEGAGARVVRVDASQNDPGYERAGQAILNQVMQALPPARVLAPALFSPPLAPTLSSPPLVPALSSPPLAPTLSSPPLAPALFFPPLVPALFPPPLAPTLFFPLLAPTLFFPPLVPTLRVGTEAALRQATLCLLLRGEPPAQVLLGYKKIGFGQGRYTGFGGKLEPGETLAQAAQREMLEESRVRVALADLDYAAQLDFIFPFKPGWSQSVHVFLARAWSGEPQESNEMLPRWFEVSQIPYDQMWADGRHWLPPLLAGRRICGRFVFDADNQNLVEVEIRDRSLYDQG